jgi:uncharacterized membrane protein YtjA (UPF0391 family)
MECPLVLTVMRSLFETLCESFYTPGNLLRFVVGKMPLDQNIHGRFFWHAIVKSICCNQILKLMLRWTITFLIIALIAAVFGFTGVAAGAASIAKIIFYIFLVFFVISLISGAFRRSD